TKKRPGARRPWFGRGPARLVPLTCRQRSWSAHAELAAAASSVQRPSQRVERLSDRPGATKAPNLAFLGDRLIEAGLLRPIVPRIDRAPVGSIATVRGHPVRPRTLSHKEKPQ